MLFLFFCVISGAFWISLNPEESIFLDSRIKGARGSAEGIGASKMAQSLPPPLTPKRGGGGCWTNGVSDL